MTRLDEVNEETDLDLTSEVYDTIGGFVLGEIGRRPVVGDRVEFDGTVFQVEAVDGLRVSRVHVWPAPKQPEEVAEV
jgi:putative hemolysin